MSLTIPRPIANGTECQARGCLGGAHVLKVAHERDVFHGPNPGLQVRRDRAELVRFPYRGEGVALGKPRHDGLGEPLLEALDGRRVKVPRRLRRLVPAVAVEDTPARRLGHAFPEVWVRGQRGGSLDEGICIVKRGQERVLAIADKLGDHTDGCGDAARPRCSSPRSGGPTRPKMLTSR